MHNFFKDSSSKLYVLFLNEVLPLFTKNTLFFQSGPPQIHKLHDRLHELFTDLFVRYVKIEVISKTENIFTLDHKERKNQLDRKEVQIGDATREHLNTLKESSLISSSQESTFFTSKHVCYV